MSIKTLLDKVSKGGPDYEMALFLHEFRNETGSDGRIELYEIRKELDRAPRNGHTDALNRLRRYVAGMQRNMDAVVLVVPAGAVEEVKNSDWAVLRAKPLNERLVSEDFPICADTLYGEQPSAMFHGTGFFVRNHLIATAAHVVAGYGKELKNLRFIQGVQFDDLRYFRSGILVHKQQVFKPVLAEGPVPHSDYELFTDGADWAMIEVNGAFMLEKAVSMPAPVQVQAREVDVDDPLYSVGHGLGLPAKVSFFGEVIRKPRNKPYFECNLTLVGGSSGSPIFSARDHSLIGIYMRGTKKLRLDEQKKCYVVKDERNPFEGQECQPVHHGSAFHARLEAYP